MKSSNGFDTSEEKNRFTKLMICFGYSHRSTEHHKHKFSFPFLPDYCDSSGAPSSSSPYDTCDSHPSVVLDSGAAARNDLLNVIAVVAAAVAIVLLALLAACVVWRCVGCQT